MQGLFKDILGNKIAISSLIREIEVGEVTQGYLFSGVGEVGKFMVAKRFAVAVQVGREYESKKALRKLIENGQHIETKVIANNGESIKIEEVRNLIYELQLSTNGEKKVVLIEDAERLTIEAANALLKTLEEPNSKVMFVLTTSKENLIPQTVVSRLRVLRFNCLSEQEMRLAISCFSPLATEDEVQEILSICNGRPGMAKKLFEDAELFGVVRRLIGELENVILKKDFVVGMKLAQEFGEEKELARVLLRGIEIAMGRLVNQEFHVDRLVKIADKVYECKKNIETNANVKMLLESIVFSIV